MSIHRQPGVERRTWRLSAPAELSRYGNFYRRIPLPEDASVDQAPAKFENGVLEVMVPVPAHETQRREITIQKASSA